MDQHYNVFDVSALGKPRVKDYNSAGTITTDPPGIRAPEHLEIFGEASKYDESTRVDLCPSQWIKKKMPKQSTTANTTNKPRRTR
jgi:hypothetical protein